MAEAKKKLRVLWLEDEPAVRDLCDAVLLENRWLEKIEIEWVGDGNRAWELFVQKKPHIFVTDVYHPGKGGFELLKLVAKSNGKLPVLVLSGFDEKKQEREKFEELCRVEFPHLPVTVMTKPFNIGALSQTIEQLYNTAACLDPREPFH